MKTSRNDIGQTVVEMPSGKHPASHFETHRLHITKTKDGHFVVEHHKQLKRKFEGMHHMSGSYMEPEQTIVGPDHKSFGAVHSLFNGKALASAAEGEGEGEGESEGA